MKLYFVNRLILATVKLKAFADDNFNVAKMLQFFFLRVEKIVRKGETLDTSFCPFPIMFSKGFFPGWLSDGTVVHSKGIV